MQLLFKNYMVFGTLQWEIWESVFNMKSVIVFVHSESAPSSMPKLSLHVSSSPSPTSSQPLCQYVGPLKSKFRTSTKKKKKTPHMQVFNLLIWKLSFIFLCSRQPKITLILVQKPKSKTPNVIHCGIDFMVLIKMNAACTKL